jgi:hypothetical protein
MKSRIQCFYESEQVAFRRTVSRGLAAVVVDTYFNSVIVTQLFKWCTAICSVSHLEA